MGAMASLPSWASGWNKSAVNPAGRLLSADQSKNLGNAIVETIIPKTDTPGAGELGVGDFVQKMVKDCYDSKAQASLSQAVFPIWMSKAMQRFGKSFADASKEQKLRLSCRISKKAATMQEIRHFSEWSKT
jgi:hypothetical protein